MSRQRRIKCETVAWWCFLCHSHLTPGYVIAAQAWVITIDTLVYLYLTRFVTPVTWVRWCSRVFKSDALRWNPSQVGLPTACVSQEECHLLRCPLTAPIGLLNRTDFDLQGHNEGFELDLSPQWFWSTTGSTVSLVWCVAQPHWWEWPSFWAGWVWVVLKAVVFFFFLSCFPENELEHCKASLFAQVAKVIEHPHSPSVSSMLPWRD